MRLYLDEDIASRHLVQALKRAGHDVTTPGDTGLLGESDTLQVTHAVRDDRICLTGNSRDFEHLHNLILLCGGSHPGIFALYGDSDRRRDLKPGQIVAAIQNVLEVLASLKSHFIRLNEWR
jgi:predicted nuclease of predicted toxin-antitoxin system